MVLTLYEYYGNINIHTSVLPCYQHKFDEKFDILKNFKEFALSHTHSLLFMRLVLKSLGIVYSLLVTYVPSMTSIHIEMAEKT